MSRTAVVVIGRNEGRRLPGALLALAPVDARVLYVDSGSRDRSVAIAHERGASVLELDDSQPFSAARSRNEGFDSITSSDPEVAFVQFVDGDCEMAPGWFDTAIRYLDDHPDTGIVCGRLRESHPDTSVYNRVAEIEWTQQAVGDVDSSGGLFMVRAQAFREVGGFDPSVLAGEEPELCRRLRTAGWKIHRLDEPMALHDAAMTRFGEWWTRQLRTGRFTMELAVRFPEQRAEIYGRTIWSARFWVGMLVAGLALAIAVGAKLGTGWGFGALTGVGGVFALQIARIRLRTMREGHDPRLSFHYAWLMMVAKIAHIIGQAWYLKNRLAGESAPLIEYKRADVDCGVRSEE